MRSPLTGLLSIALGFCSGCDRSAEPGTTASSFEHLSFPQESEVVTFSQCDPPSVKLNAEAADYVQALIRSMLATGLGPELSKAEVAAEWPWGCFHWGNFTVYAYHRHLHLKIRGYAGLAVTTHTTAVKELHDIVQSVRDEAAERGESYYLSEEKLRRLLDAWAPGTLASGELRILRPRAK